MSDVLQLVVPRLASPDAETRSLVAEAISRLLSGPSQGDIVVEAVQLVADFVRGCKCVCDPAAVRCLFALQFRDITKDDVQHGALHTPTHLLVPDCLLSSTL